jgi:hypothetical protein
MMQLQIRCGDKDRIRAVSVFCDIDLSKNAVLMQLPAEAPIRVNGIIEEISDIGWITLKDVTVRVPESQ